MSAKVGTSRGVNLMRSLVDTPLYMVKAEVEEMTAEEAWDIWGQLEPFFPGVCARASSRKRDVSWVRLVKKMALIQERAEA